MTLLSVKDLHVTFRMPKREIQAVKGVNFSIEKGEMLALVGESGSGKTLSALACMGLLPGNAIISGEVHLSDQLISGLNEKQLCAIRGKRVGMVFQEPMSALNPLHTIGRQIGEAILIHQPRAKDIDTRIHQLLESVGLSHFKDRLDAYPHQLSGGERQRVMIAIAIANDPELLIADEPTTAVDVTVQAKLLKLLKTLQKERGMAMLFITHDLTLVKRMADRVAVMKAGEIVEQGKVAEVFAAPKHEYTQRLLGSEPKGGPASADRNAAELISSQQLSVDFVKSRGVFGGAKAVKRAVDKVSVSVRSGHTLGLVGESGSGKTTLAFALLRLLPSTGEIVYMANRIDNATGDALRRLRKEMQVVFQDPYGSLNPRMTVGQIVGEGLLVHFPEISEAERNTRITQALSDVQLDPEMAERYAHEFSGGQRQRIGIARALVLTPKLIVLDEPTSALDLTIQSQIVALLKALQEKRGLSYVFISHDLRVVRAIAHELAVMKNGQIVETGPAAEVFASPKEAYTKELITAAML